MFNILIAWVYTYDKTYQIIYVKYVWIIVSTVYLIKAIKKKKKKGNMPKIMLSLVELGFKPLRHVLLILHHVASASSGDSRSYELPFCPRPHRPRGVWPSAHHPSSWIISLSCPHSPSSSRLLLLRPLYSYISRVTQPTPSELAHLLLL